MKRVEPVCPDHVHSAGQVALRVTISRDGHVKQIALLKGHPMLVKAAIYAVSQWIYEPYTLQGRPVEVETTVSVKFQCPQIARVPSPALLDSPLP